MLWPLMKHGRCVCRLYCRMCYMKKATEQKLEPLVEDAGVAIDVCGPVDCKVELKRDQLPIGTTDDQAQERAGSMSGGAEHAEFRVEDVSIRGNGSSGAASVGG